MPKKLTETKAFQALNSRNFRLYFLGQCFALTGAWMQRTAMSWLVLGILGTDVASSRLSFLELANQAPVFAIGIFTGVFLDRHDLRKVLLFTQSVMVVYSLTLAWLIYSNNVTYSYLLGMSFLLGIITAIDMPARQACVSQMITHPGQLQSALSLQSGSFNIARLAGPALGGFIINLSGELACFLINAVATFAVLYAYFIMKLPERRLSSRTQRPIDALREGFRYTLDNPPIRMVIVFNYVFCFTAMASMVLLPVFAKHILSGDSRYLGFLLGAVGLGALVGVFYIAAKVSQRELPRHICLMQSGFALSFAVFALSPYQGVSLFIAPFMGGLLVSALVSSNSLIQSLVDEDKRGRVISLYTFGLLGFGPIGALLAGYLADYIGAPYASLIFAVVCFCVTLLHWRKIPIYTATIDPILTQKGL